MASAVSGKCYPTPSTCYNCARKLCDVYAKTSEAKYKSKSENSSGTDEKGNRENGKCKADAQAKETGNTESKSKDERTGLQDIMKEKYEVDDKLVKEDHKTKSKKDYSKDTIKTEFRLKSEKSIGKDEKGNTKGQKYKIDDDKKDKMNNQTKPKNEDDREKSYDRKVFKRCTGCFLMTYCDETCQKEHWIRVHKYHCAYLSGKKVSNEHQENSCEDCIANETVSKDELFDINSPETGCRIKEESNRMRRELGVRFGFHRDRQSCTCGNQVACKYPFPMWKIRGNAVATGVDEMTVHAAKLCNAFIIKAIKSKQKKDIIDRLFVLHKSILEYRVELWDQILLFGNIFPTRSTYALLIDSRRDVGDKVDIENPWWKSLEFSLNCILTMVDSQDTFRLDKSEITDPKLIEKLDYRLKNFKNMSIITKNNLWHRFKLWPSKINNSLVLRLPEDVFCFSCNADLSGQVVGHVNICDSSNPSPSLMGGVGNNGGLIATCSAFRNFDCGKGLSIKLDTLEFTDEETQEYQTLLEKSRICHVCLKMSPTSHRCTECLASQYCSRDCQVEDWKDFHQTVCSAWAVDPPRKLMSSNKQKQVTKGKVFKLDV